MSNASKEEAVQRSGSPGDPAAGSADGTVTLWDVKTIPSKQKPEFMHEGKPKKRVTSVAFSPDGKVLASGSKDRAIILWEVETGKRQGTLRGHRGWVRSVTFSSDGKTLASGSSDGTVILWDVKTRLPLGEPLSGHEGNWVTSVAFSPDGTVLASGGADTGIVLWDVVPAEWVKRACRKANRNLTREEWRIYVGRGPYQATCPDFPSPDASRR